MIEESISVGIIINGSKLESNERELRTDSSRKHGLEGTACRRRTGRELARFRRGSCSVGSTDDCVQRREVASDWKMCCCCCCWRCCIR
jgi:hypothetical protein